MYQAGLVLVSVAILLAGSASHAATLGWSGTLRIVVVSETGAVYEDAIEDVTTFSGDFEYGDACTGTCIVEPFPPDATNYVFPDGVGSITGLGITTNGVESSVEVEDDHVVDGDEADLLTLLGYPISAGAIIDVWTVASETAGAALIFEVAFIYDTTDPFASTAYTPTPPPDPDIVIFQIDEDDGEVYLAFGEVTALPEPGSTVLLGAGWLALMALERRRRASPDRRSPP